MFLISKEFNCQIKKKTFTLEFILGIIRFKTDMPKIFLINFEYSEYTKELNNLIMEESIFIFA